MTEFPFRSALSILAFPLLLACGNESRSDVEVSEISQTATKAQTIDNCWAYAVTGWAEALHLQATGRTVDLSESYLTYWHLFEQILELNEKEDQELYDTATTYRGFNLLWRRGFMHEGDFIPKDQGRSASSVQKQALRAVKQALAKGGALSTPASRTEEMIKAVLDRAFEVDVNALQSKVDAAESLTAGFDNGKPYGLRTLMDVFGDKGWVFVGTDQNSSPEDFARTYQMVARALNDHQPVVMNVYHDWNALDMNSLTFRKSVWDRNGGRRGLQGRHVVVLADYTAKVGEREFGEGEMDGASKELAASGQITSFVAKNSWGLTFQGRRVDGKLRYHTDYLNQKIEPEDPKTKEVELSDWSNAEYFYIPEKYVTKDQE